MQTSFMHPPFGFALFFLRSVAPVSVKTSDIYWGAIPFVGIQIVMVALVIAFPQMVTFSLTKEVVVDINNIQMELPDTHYDEPSVPPSLEPSRPRNSGRKRKRGPRPRFLSPRTAISPCGCT